MSYAFHYNHFAVQCAFLLPEEEAVLEKLVDKLRAKKGLGDWFNNLADDAGEFFGNAGDVLGNLGESATDVLNIDSSEAEDIELPDDLITSGSRS